MQIRKAVGPGNNAADSLARVLDTPYLHLVRKFVPIGILAIVAGSLNGLELRFHLERSGIDFMIKRLSMSRITHAVSHVSRFK